MAVGDPVPDTTDAATHNPNLPDEPLTCLDAHVLTACTGAVEYRAPLSGTGQSFPRCGGHWEVRLARQDEINARYAPDSDVPPAGFDPLACGEVWDDDY